MMKSLVFLGLLTTASALRGMRAREGTESFLDMFDNAVEEREVHQMGSPEALIEGPVVVEQAKGNPGGQAEDGYYYYYPFQQPQSGGSSPYYYGSDTGSATVVDKDWQRPWNLINGACSTKNNGKKHAMEITSFGGGSYYLGVINIGTPPQPLNMILDTGSDEIVIKGRGCQGCKGYGYNPKLSTTSALDEQGPNKGISQFAYGSGPVVCQRVNDTVSVGDFQGQGLGMQMILETSISFFQEDDEGALHAIVGMAPGMKEYVGNTLASNMEVRTFSECLPKNPEENGFFVVNDDPADKKEEQGFAGPFKSVGEYYWAASATGMRLEWDLPSQKYKNTEQIPLYNATKPISAIVDTGTSLLSMPQGIMDELGAALKGLDFDCGRMKELPSLKFDIEGVTHSLAPEDYVAIAEGSTQSFTKKDPVFQKLFFHKPGKPQFMDKTTGHECMLLFTDPLGEETADGEMAILGMPFFREYEISFDFCTKEMFTKRSSGDCHNIVGKRPSNVQWCTDKNWFACWLEGFSNFFKSFWDGLVRIFSPGRGENIDPNDRVAQKEAKLAKIKPETLRLSSSAKWLLQTNTKDGMVSI